MAVEPIPPISSEEAKASFGATLLKLGKAVFEEAKRNARLAVLKAKNEKIKFLDLRKAHHNLGRKAYEARVLVNVFAPRYDECLLVEKAIADGRRVATSAGKRTHFQRLKDAALSAKMKVQTEAHNLKLKRLFTSMGSEAITHELPESCHHEVEAVRKIETEIGINATYLKPTTSSSVFETRREHLNGAFPGSEKGIWHPLTITLIGIPLGFEFATVLIALNWHVVRRHLWAVIAWLFAIFYFFLVRQPLQQLFAWPWLNIAGTLVWFPVMALPQLQYLRKHFPKPYPRRSWVMAIGLGIAAQAFLFIWETYGRNHGEGRTVPPSTVQQDQQREYTTEELAKKYKPYVMEVQTSWREPSRIFFLNDSDVGQNGSAVLLRGVPGSEYFLTNRHVVEAPGEAKEYSCHIHARAGQNFSPVEILAYGRNGLDLALLRLRAPDFKATFETPIEPMTNLAEGQQCVAIGNALGRGISITAGIVSTFDDVNGVRMIRTSAPISHGNSGGGLFSNKGGFLIGITSGNFKEENQNMNIAIPADYFAGKDAWDYLPGMNP